MEIQSVALGDKHNGRQTCLIETENDRYIIKPRSAQTEEAFALFCQNAAELGFGAFSRAPQILDKRDGEHTQRVEYNEITDENGADLYYQRAGVLLFFAYLLGSTDLHCENLIAVGDTPVPIDLETLLTGKPRGIGERYTLSQSVMRSHLLCNFVSDRTGVADVSGFCGVTAQLNNIPHTAQGRVYLWDKREAFVAAFERAYRLTLTHKNEVAELIHLFDGCLFRQILRPTATYAAIIAAVSRTDGDRRERATALLARAYERDVDKRRAERARLVLQREVEAVLEGEIPLFTCYGNGTSLCGDGEKLLDGHLVLSPVDYALSRLAELSEKDLARQRAIIRAAIDASAPLGTPKPSVHIAVDSPCAGEKTAAAVTAAAIDGLETVFCGLQASPVGGVDFLSFNYSLYYGLSGVLCMYAALLRKTGKAVYKDRLYRYYERVRRVFCDGHSAVTLTDVNGSLADGLLGVIACMEHIGRLTEDDAFLCDARELAMRVVLSDRAVNTDYLVGIGALPVVFEKLGVSVPASLLSLFERAEPFTTGVAHGSSGLALSLYAMRDSHLKERIDKTVLSVLQWENGQYSREDNNWYDLRDKTRKGFMGGWCSGAPGIGMARRYVLNRTDNEQLKALCLDDMQRVTRFLKERESCKKDTLCCGSAAVLTAASVLGVPVDGIYARLCAAENNNELKVTHVANTNDGNVSLMQGLSGIAYTLAMYGDPLCGGMLI